MRALARVRDTLPEAAEQGRQVLPRGECDELARVHQPQAGEYRHEAGGVDCEGGADAEARDQQAADAGPDDPRGIEERGVERDRVRQLVSADHLEGQLLAGRRVEHEHDPRQQGERVDHPNLDDAGEDHSRERRRDHHPDRLRDDDRPPGVEPVDDHAGHQPENAERHELTGREQSDRERRMGEREHQPGLRDLVDPGAALRDGLAEEVEPVVPMHAEAGERAPVDRQQRGGHSSISSCSGSSAASTAASSASERPCSRAASHAVRRDLTDRSTRSPSPETRRPTRRRSSPEGSRRISPAASRRPTYFDIPGADMRSRVASSRTPIPGWR